MAAQLEENVSGRTNDLHGNFQQLQPQRVDTVFSELLRQDKTAKPVEQIVRKRMNLNTVGVDDLLRAADVGHVKAIFAFLDEVFHQTSLAVEAELSTKIARLFGRKQEIQLTKGFGALFRTAAQKHFNSRRSVAVYPDLNRAIEQAKSLTLLYMKVH